MSLEKKSSSERPPEGGKSIDPETLIGMLEAGPDTRRGQSAAGIVRRWISGAYKGTRTDEQKEALAIQRIQRAQSHWSEADARRALVLYKRQEWDAIKVRGASHEAPKYLSHARYKQVADIVSAREGPLYEGTKRITTATFARWVAKELPARPVSVRSYLFKHTELLPDWIKRKLPDEELLEIRLALARELVQEAYDAGRQMSESQLAKQLVSNSEPDSKTTHIAGYLRTHRSSFEAVPHWGDVITERKPFPEPTSPEEEELRVSLARTILEEQEREKYAITMTELSRRIVARLEREDLNISTLREWFYNRQTDMKKRLDPLWTRVIRRK